MDILINADGLTLTDDLRATIEEKVGRVEQFAPRAIRARVYVRKLSAHHSQGQYAVHVLCEVPGRDCSAEERGPDPLSALDVVAQKIEHQLTKRKTDRLARRHRLARSRKKS